MQLKSLYADLLGRETTLATVYEIARRITAKYGADGYVLSRAIVPPQELNPKGVNVRIQVIEGWINKVEWPSKLARYRDFFSDYAAKITADRPVNIRTIERYLLLANDLPGLKFSTSLRPSTTESGASTLVVEVTEKPLDANARVDNRGTPSRGPYQFLDLSDIEQYSRSARSIHPVLCRGLAAQRAAIHLRLLQASADQRRPHGLRRRQLQLG